MVPCMLHLPSCYLSAGRFDSGLQRRNSNMADVTNIKVAVRVRPFNQRYALVVGTSHCESSRLIRLLLRCNATLAVGAGGQRIADTHETGDPDARQYHNPATWPSREGIGIVSPPQPVPRASQSNQRRTSWAVLNVNSRLLIISCRRTSQTASSRSITRTGRLTVVRACTPRHRMRRGV